MQPLRQPEQVARPGNAVQPRRVDGGAFVCLPQQRFGVQAMAGQAVRADRKGGEHKGVRPAPLEMRGNPVKRPEIGKSLKQEVFRAQIEETVYRPQQILRVGGAEVGEHGGVKGRGGFAGERVPGFQRLREGFALHVKRRKGIRFNCFRARFQIGGVDLPDTPGVLPVCGFCAFALRI